MKILGVVLLLVGLGLGAVQRSQREEYSRQEAVVDLALLRIRARVPPYLRYGINDDPESLARFLRSDYIAMLEQRNFRSADSLRMDIRFALDAIESRGRSRSARNRGYAVAVLALGLGGFILALGLKRRALTPPSLLSSPG